MAESGLELWLGLAAAAWLDAIPALLLCVEDAHGARRPRASSSSLLLLSAVNLLLGAGGVRGSRSRRAWVGEWVQPDSAG